MSKLSGNYFFHILKYLCKLGSLASRLTQKNSKEAAKVSVEVKFLRFSKERSSNIQKLNEWHDKNEMTVGKFNLLQFFMKFEIQNFSKFSTKSFSTVHDRTLLMFDKV